MIKAFSISHQNTETDFKIAETSSEMERPFSLFIMQRGAKEWEFFGDFATPFDARIAAYKWALDQGLQLAATI